MATDFGISEVDRATLIEQYNKTDDPSTLGFCFPKLFESAARNHPDAVAVIADAVETSYGTLNALSNSLAHVMVEAYNVGCGDVIGVALNRSIDLLVAILAVTKSGAAYVPIDPAFPAERISHMMENAGPKLVIVSSSTCAAVSNWDDICLNIDHSRGDMDAADSTNVISREVHSKDLAYIIYTSGSTGRPKGVEACHGALCNLFLSMQREPGCRPGDRLLAVATISFDMSILDLLLPLACGATTVLAQTSELRDPQALLVLMMRHHVTMIQATPSFWQMLLDGGWQGTNPRLSKILTAGEPISRRLMDRLLTCADEVWNGYGPTEGTIYSSVGLVHPRDPDIVIGKPVANFRLYVLDGDTLSPVPLGTLGELFIGGIGVNCGYRGNEHLTRDRFLDHSDHFLDHIGCMDHGQRLYRSGDLARWIGPGKLSLVGRTDSQVKVRGHRIELGDVSAAITEHPAITASVVVTREDQLIAYYVRGIKDATNDDRNVGPSFDRSLRTWLAERRPAYMMPAFFVEMSAFPMTLNGKIDRRALPEPKLEIPKHAKVDETRSGLEAGILDIWARVLGHNRIGIDDNFFQIGGNSLRITRMKSHLDKLLGHPVPVAKLFEHFTVRSLAQCLRDTSVVNRSAAQKTDAAPSASTHHNDNYEDIAIISMACRLPGGITSPEAYWELLERGGVSITDVPKDRWDVDAIYESSPDMPGKLYSQRGGFMKEGVFSFDAPFFAISPREARTLDPTQHIILETCWEGFERAGYTMQHLRGSNTGVFIGNSVVSAHYMGRDLADLDGYAVTGSIGASLSGRVSYVLGLEGPSLTLDTACSSSLVSTHLACTALRQRECDMAVAGGVTVMLTPGLHVEFSCLGGISADGTCRAFSADTEGTGFSEGSTAVILKRLSDAQRDGDTIHAVLRGSAVNHSGRRAASLASPSGPAQERLIRSALLASNLVPDEVDYIDAHGTATKLGDPIEGTVLAEIFGARSSDKIPLYIGSAKSNIGHTQAAAGLASILKVVLALRHSIIPRTLHVTEPTPFVDWNNGRLALVLENRPWVSEDNKPRIGGVSSFGISGTNAHVIIQEAPRAQESAVIKRPSVPTALVFLVSANSNEAVRQQIARLREHVATTIEDSDIHQLGNVAFSLATSRTHFSHRLGIRATCRTELLQKLDSCLKSDFGHSTLPIGSFRGERNSSDKGSGIAFLFTGQGSQHLGMGKSLSQLYPGFRETLEEISSHLSNLEIPLLEVIWADPGTKAAALLHRTDFAQSAIFALEVALWKLWQSWGVRPTVVMGHSVGEIAAMYAAGVLDLWDACRLVSSRGTMMQSLGLYQGGSMVSLNATASEASKAIASLGLVDKVSIAGYNTPTQTVCSGDSDAVKALESHFSTHLGRKTKLLDVSHAFHSHHMDGILPAYREVVKTLRFHAPQLSVVSSLTGKRVGLTQLEQPDYWVQQVRDAVRFKDAIYTISHESTINIFVELGPQPILLGLAAACLTDQPSQDDDYSLPTFLPSLKTGKEDDILVAQSSLVELHMKHVFVDWPAYYRPFHLQRIQLPTYAFQRERYNWHNYSPVVRSSPGHTGSLIQTYGNDFQQIRPKDVGEGNDRSRFEIQWHRILLDLTKSVKSKSWGLLLSSTCNTAWVSRVTTALSKVGHKVVHIQALQDAETLDGVLCLWDNAIEGTVPQRALEITNQALSLLQNAAEQRFSPPIVWVTIGAVGVPVNDSEISDMLDERGDSTVDQSKAERLHTSPLWGLLRTARSELRELRLRLIDLDDRDRALEVLALALSFGEDQPECAVRRDQIFCPQIVRAEASKQHTLTLRPNGAVLITGGLGGIGKQVAKWLASTYSISDLVLLSRRGMQSSDAANLVGDLRRLGASATVVTCDVSSLESLRQVFTMFTDERPLRAVIHAAGVVDNGVLSSMTPQRCATTFAPKVDGAWHLHQLTRNLDLDVFMMFSSIAGVLGMPGLGNYAAANTFLDALAHFRHEQNLPASSVAYGVWGGDGMAEGLTGRTTLTHLAKFGLDQLEPQEALELLDKSMGSGSALTVAAALDLERLQVYLEEDQSAEENGIPTFYRALLSHHRAGQSSDTKKAQSHSRKDQLRKALDDADPKQHAAVVLAAVRETVGKTLGFTSTEQIDVDVPLQDIGIDSLTAIMMRNQLAQLTGVASLSVSSVTWDHPNLRALSLYLLSRLDLETENQPRSLANSAATIPISSDDELSLAKKGFLHPSLLFETEQIRRPQSIFITGGTGFVGAFILHDLLELGIRCYCLVRAQDVDHGMQRLVETLAAYDLWQPAYGTLLTPVIGDLSKLRFELDDVAFNDLADSVDAICHCGALVDWMRPLSEYLGPNVASVHESLRLASLGRTKALHVISTLATLPLHLGYSVPENDREYGYSTSKYMAERMVLAARWRGASASVYRVPFVSASGSTGHFRQDRGDFLHNMIVGCLEMGSYPSLDADLSVVLPVDYLSRTIVDVMVNNLPRIGQDFDFVNKYAVSLVHFFNLMGVTRNSDKEELHSLPWNQWQQEALKHAADNPKSSLARIAAVIDNLSDEVAAAGMLKGLPTGKHIFGGDIYPAPLVDEQLVRRYSARIDAATASGSIA